MDSVDRSTTVDPAILMKIQFPKTYSQNDPQWRNLILGSRGTIGEYGCLVADAAMVCTYFGHEETPETLNEKLRRNNGYQNGNLFVWGAITALYPDIAYQGQVQTPDPLTASQMDAIRSALDNKFPVFLQIDTIPSTSGLDEHWVLAVGYDGDDFIVQDPWDGAEKRITSWGVPPQELIYAYAYYAGTPSVAIVDTGTSTGTGGRGVNVEGATFELLVQKSTQWDIVADTLFIDRTDAMGGVNASQKIQQLQRDLATAQNVVVSRKTGEREARSAEPPHHHVENSSIKPFWESKKFIVTTITSVLSAALVIIQTAQIGPEDTWESIASKLLSATIAALGISVLGNQYVKVQGAIDNTAAKNENI